MALGCLQLKIFLLEIFVLTCTQNSIYLFSSFMSRVLVVEGFENDNALFPTKCYLFP